jgi:hypothetical protein
MTISHRMRIFMHFRFAFGFTSEVSLSQDGAVGARVIQAVGGGAVKLLPSACDLASTQVGGDFSPEGGGFSWDCTKPAEFLAPLTAFFT